MTLISPALPLAQKTVYFSEAMQTYMYQEIKKPILEAVDILFRPGSSAIQKAKAFKLLWNAFNAFKGLPEPTKENTWHPNTHALIDLRDYVLHRCHLDKLRTNLIRRCFDTIIIIHAFDPPWRWIFDSIIEQVKKTEWKPRGWNDTWVDTYNWWREE